MNGTASGALRGWSSRPVSHSPRTTTRAPTKTARVTPRGPSRFTVQGARLARLDVVCGRLREAIGAVLTAEIVRRALVFDAGHRIAGGDLHAAYRIAHQLVVHVALLYRLSGAG